MYLSNNKLFVTYNIRKKELETILKSSYSLAHSIHTELKLFEIAIIQKQTTNKTKNTQNVQIQHIKSDIDNYNEKSGSELTPARKLNQENIV